MISIHQHTKPRPHGALRYIVFRLLIILAIAGTSGEAAAQPSTPPTDLTPRAGGTPIPDQYKINMLIRTTLIALSQANQTGNYSVLRDLGTPQFQAINSDARLAEIFSELRQRNLDLSPILFFDPTMIRPPALQDDGMLRTTGFIDTKPERVLFDMGFQPIEGRWRLTAIVVEIKAPKIKPAEQTSSEKGPPDTGSKAPGSQAPAPNANVPRAEKKAHAPSAH